jgi:hypothetical protein
MSLLVKDPNPDIAIRAIRVAGRQKNEQLGDYIGGLLKRADTPPIVAAEAMKSLIAINSSATKTYLESFNSTDPNSYPHRGSAVVKEILRTYLDSETESN